MIEAITLDGLHNLSDTALWALFDDTQDLLEELPCGSWERGIALANLRLIVSMIDRRRMAATVRTRKACPAGRFRVRTHKST